MVLKITLIVHPLLERGTSGSRILSTRTNGFTRRELSKTWRLTALRAARSKTKSNVNGTLTTTPIKTRQCIQRGSNAVLYAGSAIEFPQCSRSCHWSPPAFGIKPWSHETTFFKQANPRITMGSRPAGAAPGPQIRPGGPSRHGYVAVDGQEDIATLGLTALIRLY